MKFDIKTFRVLDWFLFLIPIILVLLGISIIYSMTYFTPNKIYIDQIIFACIGFMLMMIFTFLDYRQLKASSRLIYIAGIILLVLVLVVGKSSFGSSRWINLGFFDLQPSELFKLILIIGLANFLCDKVGKLNIRNILIAFLIAIVPMILVIMQPDLGTAIVFAVITLTLIFFSKLKLKQIITLILVGFLLIPAGWFVLKDYQKDRLMTFINPENDPYGAGYNVTQSLITVGSGGMWGKGFGRGPQSQLNFLPVAHTDFVFAGIAESIGFVGSGILLLIIVVFVIRIVRIANISKDNFGSLVAIGIGSVIFFQSVVNIGMNIGLLPVTGIPLPFISYGGSSLVVMFISIGILQSIYLRHRKITFK